jgi:DNA-binding CsgD family transcriptional regulator
MSKAEAHPDVANDAAALAADLQRADREIAAHLAVATALSEWDSLEAGGTRLLRELAAALDFAVGVLWLPRSDVLEPGLFCALPLSGTPEYERATRGLRLPLGIGLPGEAWMRREPVAFEGLVTNNRFVRREAAGLEGLNFGLAIPALIGREVLAVVELCSRYEAQLTERLRSLLVGVAYELGGFLAQRRAVLRPPLLTPRQLEVLQLASWGLSSPQIADQLVISSATVKTHFEHIYQKLGVSDRAAAVAQALRQGLLD